MTDMPEVDKFAAIHEEFGIVVQFMEWAQDNGYHFTRSETFTETGTKLHNGEEYEYEVTAEVPARVEDALYDFFEVDYKKLDRERRMILAEARRQQNLPAPSTNVVASGDRSIAVGGSVGHVSTGES